MAHHPHRFTRTQHTLRTLAQLACLAPLLLGSHATAQETAPPAAQIDRLTMPPLFPADNPWNTDISDLPVHDNSDAFIASIGPDTQLHPDFGTVWNDAPNGIPFVLVRGNQPEVPITFLYEDESDPGPYPIPPRVPIEGGPNGQGDRHIIIVDVDNHLLYEVFRAFPFDNATRWEGDSGAVFDLTSNDLRPLFWTSADAAGLPILPGLVRFEEAAKKLEINHALRFTVSQSQRAFILPATHFASSSRDPDLPPMGLRLRLKAEVDITGYSETNQAILQALKTFGMFVADNGSDMFLSGAPDHRWDDDELRELKQIQASDFEVVYTGEPISD